LEGNGRGLPTRFGGKGRTNERGLWSRSALLSVGILFCLLPSRPSLAEKVPQCLVYLPSDPPGYALVVEKATARLSLYVGGESGPRLVRSYPCSVGRVRGDKSRPGDQKTPSGIYWMEEFVPGRRLPPRYGAGALVLNYPNFFDRLRRRGGDGIWIHGTAESDRIRNPRSTDGCVVIRDEDLQDLVSRVRILETPVIIRKRIGWLERRRWERQQRAFLERLQLWIRSWEGGDGREIKPLYSKRFVTDPKGAAHLIRVRRHFARRLKGSRVRIRGLYIIRDGSRAISLFQQEWRGSQGVARWSKVLYWVREKGLWRILGEEFLERPPTGLRPAGEGLSQ